jgi:hypothetical protein
MCQPYTICEYLQERCLTFTDKHSLQVPASVLTVFVSCRVALSVLPGEEQAAAADHCSVFLQAVALHLVQGVLPGITADVLCGLLAQQVMINNATMHSRPQCAVTLALLVF